MQKTLAFFVLWSILQTSITFLGLYSNIMNSFKKITEKIFAFEEETLRKFKKQTRIERMSYQAFDTTSFPIVGITGLRWVGKTSYLLKKRSLSKNAVYISCDRKFLASVDFLELLLYLYHNFAITFFLLDEIQVLPDRIVIIKNVFDALDIRILFSGSNKIHIETLWYDLSRRLILKSLPPFSYAEYIAFKYGVNKTLSWNDIIQHPEKSSKSFSRFYNKEIDKQEYLSYGEFGYFYQWAQGSDFCFLLNNSLRKSIHEDIPHIAHINTSNLAKIENILVYISNMWASQININTLSKKVWLDNKTTKIYIEYLERLWRIVSLEKHGMLAERLRKEKKIYLLSNNLMSYLANKEDENFLGKQRESFFLQNILRVLGGKDWVKIKTRTDFIVFKDGKEYAFEVGWMNKKRSDGVYVVKDDILLGNKKEIPLWLFGFLR